MRKSIEIVTCDLCGAQCDDVVSITYPVVFLTEQTEGHPCKPYIDMTDIDVCQDCKKRILMVNATGCMGFNEYKLVMVDA